jgi:hypothetical protein
MMELLTFLFGRFDVNEDVSPYSDHRAWEVLHQFAGSDSMTLPEAEERLQTVLGSRYRHNDWSEAFKCVMDAENDVAKAQQALRQCAETSGRPKLIIRLPPTRPPQLVAAETSLLTCVQSLKDRNRIFGDLPTIDELIDPISENEILTDSPYAFPGGDLEIVAEVEHEERVRNGEITDESDDGGEEPECTLSRTEAVILSGQLEHAALTYLGDNIDISWALIESLRKFRAQLKRDDLLNSQQTSITSYFGFADTSQLR